MTTPTKTLLPPEQFGGRHSYSATDDVLDIIQKIETTKDIISAILIDIQNVFDKVNSNILTDPMEKRNLPKSTISWTYQFIRDRKESMLMDQKKGHVCDISTGIPQG